MMLKTTKGKRI
jgi:uncharacterized membrane protein